MSLQVQKGTATNLRHSNFTFNLMLFLYSLSLAETRMLPINISSYLSLSFIGNETNNGCFTPNVYLCINYGLEMKVQGTVGVKYY